MRSDVVIVAHNPGHLLQEAVTSAAEQAGPEHVWVIDAECTDGSVQKIRDSGVNIISAPNRGFSAGNNRGIETGHAPFVLLLNPDASLRPDALDTMISAATGNPRAGIVGALILNADGSVQANTFGRFPSLLEALRIRVWRVTQRLRGNRTLSPGAPSSTASFDWVSGAAMLVRREAIAEVGPMDEGFFLYREDVDWCHRMHDHGWDVLLEPKALVVHHLGRAAAPKDKIALAYRASFYRYCDLYGLWGLKLSARLGLFFRRMLGGAP